LHQVALTAETGMAAARALEARLRGTLTHRRVAAEHALHQLQNDPRATDEQRRQAAAALASIRAEMAAVTAEIERIAPPAVQAGRLLNACRDWILQTKASAR
jgi:predicted  nucleic acid-binding Zn-ribbon protein